MKTYEILYTYESEGKAIIKAKSEKEALKDLEKMLFNITSKRLSDVKLLNILEV